MPQRTNQRGGGQPGSLGRGSQRSCCLLRGVFWDVEPDVHLGEDRQAEEGWAQSLGEKGLKSPTRTPRMLNVQSGCLHPSEFLTVASNLRSSWFTWRSCRAPHQLVKSISPSAHPAWNSSSWTQRHRGTPLCLYVSILQSFFRIFMRIFRCFPSSPILAINNSNFEVSEILLWNYLS